ncbi:MAG: DUF3987 domain-containing protein, partial [Proteobacteria bacterium]|nr:DUF3987 domain-containing protein [Pseudomonadota bacterium]
SMDKLKGRAQWVRDEYGQLLKQFRDNNARTDLRDILLRAYDHSTLVNKTLKRGEITVKKPVLCLYGTTVDTTFIDCVDVQMLTDGFCARHLFVVCSPRPIAIPRYPRDELLADFRAASGGLSTALSTQTHFQISEEADRVYKELWHSLVSDLGDQLDAAYLRRITWSAARYAAIYHVLLGRPGVMIGVEAMRWAWRMVMLHCDSTRQVLLLTDRSLAGRMERISAMVLAEMERGVDVRSSQFTRRVIQRFRRDLRTVPEVHQMIDLIISLAFTGSVHDF